MNASTLKALKQSIAHWKRMATGKSKKREAPEGEQCALCKIFNNVGVCTDCPVREKTGFHLCQATPFQDAWDAFATKGKRSAKFKEAAQKELKFLQSLLPKTTKRKTTKA